MSRREMTGVLWAIVVSVAFVGGCPGPETAGEDSGGGDSGEVGHDVRDTASDIGSEDVGGERDGSGDTAADGAEDVGSDTMGDDTGGSDGSSGGDAATDAVGSDGSSGGDAAMDVGDTDGATDALVDTGDESTDGATDDVRDGGDGDIVDSGSAIDADADVDGGTTDASDTDTSETGMSASSWTRLFGTQGVDYFFDVAIGGAGAVYVVGRIGDGIGSWSYMGGISDAVLAKYDATGTHQWTRPLGSSGEDLFAGVEVDGAGDVYVAGGAAGGIGNQTFQGGRFDALLAKYDSSGNRKWIRMFGSADADAVTSIALNGTGDLYVTGAVGDTVGGQSFNGGQFDGVLAKYDTSGARQWLRLLGTSGRDILADVAIDGSGEPYVAGEAEQNIGGQTHNGAGDAVVSKYTASGNRQWVRLLGSSSYDVARGIEADGSGHIYIAGRAGGAIGGQTFNGGATDALLAEYDTSGMRQWVQLHGAGGTEFAGDLAVVGGNQLSVIGSTTTQIGGKTVNGNQDAFLTEHDLSGNRQSVRLIGGPGEEEALGGTAPGSTLTYVVGATDQAFDGQPYNGGRADGFVTAVK